MVLFFVGEGGRNYNESGEYYGDERRGRGGYHEGQGRGGGGRYFDRGGRYERLLYINRQRKYNMCFSFWCSNKPCSFPICFLYIGEILDFMAAGAAVDTALMIEEVVVIHTVFKAVVAVGGATSKEVEGEKRDKNNKYVCMPTFYGD
jgi:hypothetical protein